MEELDIKQIIVKTIHMKYFLYFLLLSSCIFAKAQDTYNIRQKAETGDVSAQYALGKNLLSENNYSSKVEGLSWLKRAALQNESMAQYMVGWCYYYGEGPTRTFL